MLRGPGHNGWLSLLCSLLVLSMSVEARKQAAEKARLCNRCLVAHKQYEANYFEPHGNSRNTIPVAEDGGGKTEEFMFVPGKG